MEGGLSKLNKREDRMAADDFLDFVLTVESVAGIEDEDKSEGDDPSDDNEEEENEENDEEEDDDEVRAALLADAILNGPPPKGEKPN